MAATIIPVNDATRKFFAKVQFPEIPEEAKYVAFEEDGATFFSELEFSTLPRPKIAVITYYEVEELL